MKPFPLMILTPNGLVYEGEVLEGYFPTIEGPLGILPGHTPYLAQLAESGVIRLKEANGNLRYFAVHEGALEVRPDKTIVLSESCVSSASLEAANALLSSTSGPQKAGEKDVERAAAALASEYGASRKN
jgi:F-type H+-transporting ATPase subunit epsilon